MEALWKIIPRREKKAHARTHIVLQTLCMGIRCRFTPYTGTRVWEHANAGEAEFAWLKWGEHHIVEKSGWEWFDYIEGKSPTQCVEVPLVERTIAEEYGSSGMRDGGFNVHDCNGDGSPDMEHFVRWCIGNEVDEDWNNDEYTGNATTEEW
jgi:hypothetical protein